MRIKVNQNTKKRWCIFNYCNKFNFKFGLTAIGMSVVALWVKTIGLFALMHGFCRSLKMLYHFINHYKSPASISQRACVCVCVYLFMRVGPTIFSWIRPWTMSKKTVYPSLVMLTAVCSNCNCNDSRMCIVHHIHLHIQRSTVQHKPNKCHIT